MCLSRVADRLGTLLQLLDTSRPWAGWIQEESRDPLHFAVGTEVSQITAPRAAPNFSQHSLQHVPIACCWPSPPCAFGSGSPMHAFPPKQEQCMWKTKCLVLCSSPSRRHEGGSPEAVRTVAVRRVPPSTGRQEEGSGAGTSSKADFMVCKVGGEQGIREKESQAALIPEKSKRIKSCYFSIPPPRCWGPCLWLRWQQSLVSRELLLSDRPPPATPAGEGEPTGIGRSGRDPTAAAPTGGKGTQAIPASAGLHWWTVLHSTSQLLINTGVKPNASAPTSLKAQTQPPNGSISGRPSHPQFQCRSSPIQAYSSCWFSKLSITATARHGIRQSEDLTKRILLLFKPSCNTWRELHLHSSTLPTNTSL